MSLGFIYKYFFFSFLIIFLSSWLILFTGFVIFSKHVIFMLIIFFIFYWIYSIFLFLYKKTQYSIYVSTIQRFWKRSLYLFWLIELFLFFIYLFLMLNSPNETYYLLDHKVLFHAHDSIHLIFFLDIRGVLTLIWLISFSLLWNMGFFFNVLINTVIFGLLMLILWGEFTQTFTLLNIFQNFQFIYSTELKRIDKTLVLYQKDKETGGHALNLELLSPEFRKIEEDKMKEKPLYYEMYNFYWNLEQETLRYRTYRFYFYLVTILKLWHIIFVILMYFVSIRLIFQKTHWSVNLLSGNLQNFYFLFIFVFLNLLLVIKYYMQILYSPQYFYFFFSLQTWEVFFRVFTKKIFFYEIF